MLLALSAMVLVTALSVAAFTAVNTDTPLSNNDSYQKEAYSAAQAGIQQYLFDLDSDNGYWEQCVPTSNNHGINLNGSTANQWQVAGTTNEWYAIELMPAAGQTTYTQCNTADPLDSMIQALGDGAGSLRIRSTGIVKPGGGAPIVTRTVVANLRENGFLNYVYFTNYETSDPQVQAESVTTPTSSNWDTVDADAEAQCAGTTSAPMYRYDGRYDAPFYGTTYCDEIDFISQDNLNGPFHTNDQAEICGTAAFGRSGDNDEIQMGGSSSPGYYQDSGCSGNPVFNNTAGAPTVPGGILPMPSADSSLKSIATLSLTGTVCMTLYSTYLTYVELTGSESCTSSGLPTPTTVDYSTITNGVIYDATGSSGCTLTYDPYSPQYSGNTGCATVYVSGTYGSSLTIATEDDIVIDGNITHSGTNTLMGLIADGFVRVYNPCSSASLTNPTIDAMIMSLNHSFIVDNYNCSPSLGTLTVNGGIAQDFRGAVGTFSGSASNPTLASGYIKQYNYDERLAYEEPPFFLNPTSTTWDVIREDECAPTAGSTATTC